MKSTKVLIPTVLVALVLFAALLVSLPAFDRAAAAPAAAPTPVSVTRPGGTGEFATFTLFATQAITADTTSTCFDVGKFSLADIQYTIDQGTTNTVTLTTKWSVDGGTLTSGANVVASNAADASDMVELQTFGRYMCVLADVSNTNEVTVTAKAFVK